MRIAAIVVAGVCAAHVVMAQEFVPPKNGAHRGTRIGLFGFGVRGGIDVRGAGQLVLGTTLDVGNPRADALAPAAEALGLPAGDPTAWPPSFFTTLHGHLARAAVQRA